MSFPTAVKGGKEKVSSSVCAAAEESIVGLGQHSYSIHRLFCSVPYGCLIQRVSCSNKSKSFLLENEARHYLRIPKREDNFGISKEKVPNFSLYCRGHTSKTQG